MNPWESEPVLIASSHLARRPAEQERLLAAGPYDLVIVDEAHHARRTHIDEDEYRPGGRLLELLDRITQRGGAAKALWLLTATPMQVAPPIELRDLLIHVGLQGPLSNPPMHSRSTSAKWLGVTVQRTERRPGHGWTRRCVIRLDYRVPRQRKRSSRGSEAKWDR